MSEQEQKENSIMKQMLAIEHRLKTYPFHEHQAATLRDCLVGLIRCMKGEVFDTGIRTASSYDSATERPPGIGDGFEAGQEVAPGVVMYPAKQPALIDVKGSMPKPIPGSIAYGVEVPERKVG